MTLAQLKTLVIRLESHAAAVGVTAENSTVRFYGFEIDENFKISDACLFPSDVSDMARARPDDHLLFELHITEE